MRRAFEAANKNGDLTYAAYCGNQMNTNFLAAGDPLAEAEREAEHGLAFAQKARFGFVIDVIASQLGLIRTLRGLTPTFGSFDDEQFEERADRAPLFRKSGFGACRMLVLDPQAAGALFCRRLRIGHRGVVDERSRLLWTSPSRSKRRNITSTARCLKPPACDSAAAGERQQHLDAVAAHHKQLQLWAANCPDNFENRAALVGAEIARIEGRDGDAMRLYEQAIRSARANGFVHNEALANELAARFYAARGFEEFAHVYLRNARYGYLRWGADGKVRQLDEMYPHLREEEPAPAPTSTIGAPVEHLDLATVIKVSQAVSGEIVLEKLIDTLMRTAIEHAGAERGLLILSRGARLRIEAEATTGGDTVAVQLRDQSVTASVLPESVLHYVLRTGESVILDDAAAQPPFAADPYIRQRQARSVLCLPLITQAKLIGVLYLENNLASHVFTPARIAVLKLLASQAAIALENARLYRDLADLRDLENARPRSGAWSTPTSSGSAFQSICSPVSTRLASISRARSTAGLCCECHAAKRTRPFVTASRCRKSSSPTVAVGGFSNKTCLPALRASQAIAKRAAGGVQIATTSTAASVSSASWSRYLGTPARAAPLMSATQESSNRGSPAIAGAWRSRAILPKPIRPTRCVVKDLVLSVNGPETRD